MSSNLVIVESPAKARTIEKYLGGDFKVMASYGHVRDLPSKDGAVDTDDGFHLTYQLAEDKAKHVEAIAKALRKAGALLLATDPDREGEAISWHLLELMRERGLLEGKEVHRVVFHEITARAIRDAVEHPREISYDLVNAQQARRALDYLVGFNLSPLLWRKIRGGLSAGRVQSPALRMIVEREKEIEAFVPREYWSVEADLAKDGTAFRSRLTMLDGDKFEQFTITDRDTAQAARERLLAAADGVLPISKIDRKQRRRNPAPPFTTSTLQQEASRKLGLSASRTMRLAQRLYEGVDVGEGLITYMRTDSVTLANDALSEIRSVIADRYGPENVPDKPRTYKTKARNAQEAHEAVRPTSAARTPDSLRGKLDDAEYKLYELIWRRTVACQMVPAVYDTMAVDLACGEDHRFRANGSVLVEPGFISVYMEGKDDNGGDDDDDRKLPPLEVGDRIDLKDVLVEQHFTEPPPRYSEASLVKTLEEYGIGRPSTYASIISTLTGREYVELVSKRFHPTDTGRVVNSFLTEHFTPYVDYAFTAQLEDELDEISRGEKDWVALMREFWSPFHELVEEKQNLSRQEVNKAREIGVDPESGRPVSVRMGRYGPFVQIGTRDDEEKPKFAGLRPGQRMDTITLEEALPLFQLPRNLGHTPEGEEIQVNIGRFGPYVRFGDRFASIRKDSDDDPYTITLERALVLIEEKKEADRKRTIRDFEVDNIKILRGRWGPYVTDGDRNARVPKDEDAEALTLERCREMLAAAPPKKGRRKKAAKKKAAKKKASKKKASRKKASKKKASKKKASKKKASRKADGGADAPAQD